MGWAGHVGRMGKERGVYRVLFGKPERRSPLGRPRRRRVDNIRMDLYDVRCGYMDCISYIYSTNICIEYFKHGIYSPFHSLFKMQFVS